MPNTTFEFILGRNNRGNRFQICTLSALYRLCLSKGKNGTYNDVLIDEILADSENVKRYSNGIEGYCMVEVSKSHKVEGEYAFVMSYPASENEKSQVKIIFNDKKLFWRQYDKLNKLKHMEPVIIAGDWELTPNETEYHSQCVIHRGRQIYYLNE